MYKPLAGLLKGIKMSYYKRIFTKDRSKSQLSTNEVFSLDVIRLLGKPTIGAFAKFINVPLSNATYKINMLIEKGFIRKSKSEQDRREFYLELTEKCNGLELDDSRQLAIIQRIEDRLSPHQMKVLEKILEIADEEITNELQFKEF